MNYVALVGDILDAILKLVLAFAPNIANNTIILELQKVIGALKAV